MKNSLLWAVIVVQGIAIVILALRGAEDTDPRRSVADEPSDTPVVPAGDGGHGRTPEDPVTKDDAWVGEGGIVWGRVTHDGVAVETAAVHPAETRGSFVVTSRDGLFVLRLPSRGPMVLVCRRRGFATARVQIPARSRALYRQDIEMRAARSIRVVLKDDAGHPLSLSALKSPRKIHPRVVVFRRQPPALLPPNPRNRYENPRLFRYTPAGPGGGTLEIRVGDVSTLWIAVISRRSVLDFKRIDGDTATVELTVDPRSLARQLSTVRLRLVDAQTGQWIESARVSLEDTTMEQIHNPRKYPRGIVTFSNVASGVARLRINAHGYEAIRGEVVVPPSQAEIDLGSIRMTAATTFRGSVRGSDGSASLAHLIIRRKSPPPALSSDRRNRFRTDEEGRFEIRSLGKGPYVLVFDRPRFARKAVEIDVGATNPELHVTLEKGHSVTLVAEKTWDFPRLVQVLQNGLLLLSEYLPSGSSLHVDLAGPVEIRTGTGERTRSTRVDVQRPLQLELQP